LAYRVELATSAAKELRELKKRIQPRLMESIGERIDALAEDPRPPGVEKIEGHDDLWRVRAGKDYRIVYTVEDDVLLVVVAKIGHRREVYRDL
jgi:mRNA interferase RelE/StbE